MGGALLLGVVETGRTTREMRRAKDSKIYGLGLFLISLSLFLYMWLPLGLNAQQLQLDKVIPLTEGRLPNGGYFSPRWSPDGKKIAVTRRHYKGIYAIDIDGGGLKTITEDDGAGFRFSWSPDSEVAFVNWCNFQSP